ncbi:MAG: ABC transporter substrate-binding protein [Treponema sp.]|nr:ABC transporter substrate-binding protein [Treponema sp.]
MKSAPRPRNIFFFLLALLLLVCLAAACTSVEEVSLEEWEAMTVAGLEELLAQTQFKPWQGEEFVTGQPGGTWLSGFTAEPKTFNILVAELDNESSSIVMMNLDYLVNYDVIARQFTPQAAFFEIDVDEEEGTLRVIYTLRDDLYWSFYNSPEKIPVTSDDVIFWYDVIQGDRTFNSSAYGGQFMSLEDGSRVRIPIVKIDDKSFYFPFPRIVANPLLTTNMTFGPSFIYQRAFEEGGHQAVLDLFNIATDPTEIPSMGRWFLTEYVPGLRLVFRRNPNYWETNAQGHSYPYVETNVVQILPDLNTQFLVFLEGRIESYSSRPEDLDTLIQGQSGQARQRGRRNSDYSVFNAEGSLGASFWSFNQNPRNSEENHYLWFSQKEFRQAMSCILNRDRIIAQVYRGLADPKLDFFAPPNPFYNDDIQLQYTYDPQRAIELLASIGIRRDEGGIMRDWRGHAIEFDLTITSDMATLSDMASILADEAAQIGIQINIRPTDFQRIVEQLTFTFDWQSVFIGLGVNFWPTGGSNVWPSHGNLHLWHPNQESPYTEWEARVDVLYNEGSFTADPVRAQVIWDEFQSILLEELPVIYLLRSRTFYAIQNRWDFDNFYFDNLNGAETSYLFLRRD